MINLNNGHNNSGEQLRTPVRLRRAAIRYCGSLGGLFTADAIVTPLAGRELGTAAERLGMLESSCEMRGASSLVNTSPSPSMARGVCTCHSTRQKGSVATQNLIGHQAAFRNSPIEAGMALEGTQGRGQNLVWNSYKILTNFDQTR